MTTPKKSKIDRVSFRSAFNLVTLDENTEYDVTLITSEDGYVPDGLTEHTPSSKPGRVIIATGKGSVIEALENDPKILRVAAPARYKLL